MLGPHLTKAFDKVWHRGLKYKILGLGLPVILKKLLCNFLDGRSARIKLESFLGDSFDIRCGVPQGSVLSPTLFILYTNDAPAAGRGINLSYADDVTHISGYPGRSREIARRQIAAQINTQSVYEKDWRIHTNESKFSIFNLGARLHENISTNTRAIATQHQGTLLGLTISRSGYASHINKRCDHARTTLGKLYRFRTMPTKLKLHLVKTLIIPILEHPPVPTHTLSKTQISKLQKVQNKALRFATNQFYASTLTNEQIHINTNTFPINIRLHLQATRIWARIALLNLPLHTHLTNNLPNIERFNHSFPSSLRRLQSDSHPEPCYY